MKFISYGPLLMGPSGAELFCIPMRSWLIGSCIEPLMYWLGTSVADTPHWDELCCSKHPLLSATGLACYHSVFYL